MLISLFAKHPDSNPTYNAFVTASLVGTLTPIDLNVFAVKSKWNFDLGFDMGHLKAIMRILCAAAEGAPIPGLKAAAQIGLEIVEAVDVSGALSTRFTWERMLTGLLSASEN